MKISPTTTHPLSSACLIVLLAKSNLTRATYSIVAVDREDQFIGGAGATCVQGRNVLAALYHGVPGFGVLHTQAVTLEGDSEAVLTAQDMIQNEEDPEIILERMRNLDNNTLRSPIYLDLYGFPDTVPDYEFRQNAVVDLKGRAAAYTGPSIAPLYEALGTFGTSQEDNQGTIGDRFAYSVQGNVVEELTVSVVAKGFAGLHDPRGEGCDLPDRMMIALLAVPDTGTDSGDARCIRADLDPKEAVGTPAAGAFIKVEAADSTVLLELNVIGDGVKDPTVELKSMYDDWRLRNPCPGGSTATTASSDTITPTATDAPTPAAHSSGDPCSSQIVSASVTVGTVLISFLASS
ncbi:Family of unknown function (DUF1028) [Seminavis robusta]|uniref:Uncharacterized protein n=1 Tax=Seminavis robusta TaxID=568900 RepID=A0A9N8EEJ2_9STRA|nr:Family of unknown function (DUF1028) [Seminavis robusta]|eukprot:Sro821_g207430.1 Family of unknown function (DUF1028) (349) ;mRNA; r:38891-39937